MLEMTVTPPEVKHHLMLEKFQKFIERGTLRHSPRAD
jgi:hypothetical protein